MEQVFLYILDLSYKSIIVICIAIVARLIIRKTPKIFSYVLWSVVFIRLVLPIGIKINVNTDYNKNVISRYMQSQQLQNLSQNKGEQKSSNLKIVKNNTEVSDFQKYDLIVKILTYIWVIGLCVILFLSVMSYVRIRAIIRVGVRIKDNIYVCSNIDTPFVFGIIKPNIYLPYSFNDQEKEYIIAHEMIHIKRRDYVVKVIYFIIVCIHWFNPLVWISFNLMESDMELSCDEMVINKMGLSMKKQYSTCLLNMATKSNEKPFCPVGFSEKRPEKRIRNILKYKGKNKKCMFTTGLFISLIMATMFIKPSINNIVITDNKIIVKPTNKQESFIYNLYFNDLNAEYLIPEQRKINSYNPKDIIEELIMGPQEENLSSCISNDIKINSISIKDNIAYVDFDKSVEGKVNGSCGETMFTYGIVNTLVLNKEFHIKGVRFYIDGKNIESIGGHLDHSGVMEANLSLIKK